MEKDAGLRILSHLVEDVRHLQDPDCDVLQLTVDSRPLAWRPTIQGLPATSRARLLRSPRARPDGFHR